MKRYSKSTVLVSRALDACPSLKRVAKNLYYRFCSVVYRKPYRYLVHTQEMSVRNLCPPGYAASFFGYYDKSPWNADGNLIAGHATKLQATELPSAHHPVSVFIYDTARDTYEVIGESHSWNWQQGSRLCWMSPHKVIFNDYSAARDCYVARIVDVRDRSTKEMLFAINDVYRDEFALTLNYDRLHKLRPDYGYRNRPHGVEALKATDDKDGIWKGDLRSGRSDLILTLNQLQKLDSHAGMAKAWHKINHIMIAPSGSSFLFLHRWYAGGRKRTRLVVASVDCSKLQVVLDEEMVSHCTWLDDATILCWARYNGRENYYILDVANNKVAPAGDFGLLGDGHPSLSPDRELVVSDTYPDRSRMRYVLLLNLAAKECKRICEFYEPPIYSDQTRCDLHPRWSPHSDEVACDTIYDLSRRLTLISGVRKGMKE